MHILQKRKSFQSFQLIFYQYNYTIFTMKRILPIKSEHIDAQASNSNAFIKRLAVTYSILLIIFLCIGFGLYNLSTTRVTEGIKNQNRLSLSAGADEISSVFQTINAIGAQISSNSAFTDYATSASPSDQDFYVRAVQLQRDLVPLISIEKMLPISRSYIYLKNTGYIISYSQFTEKKLYYRGIRSFYEEGYEQWLSYISDDANWYQVHPITDFDPSSRDLLYIVPLSSSSTLNFNKIPAVLCYEFEYDALMRCFSDVNLFEKGYIAVLKNDGSVNFVLSPEDMSPTSVDAAALTQADYTEGSAYITDSTGKNMLVTQVSASSYDWDFYLVQPADQALYSLNTYQSVFSLILLLSIVIGIAMVYLFTVLNAKPVVELNNELVMEKAVTADLSELVKKHRPIVNESFVRRIMEGSVSIQGEMDYIVDALGLQKPNRKYCVLFIKAFPSSDTIVHSDNMDFCIQNYDILVRDAIARYFPDTGYIYKPDDRNFAVLLSSDQDAECDEVFADIEKRFVPMHDELLNHYGIWVNGGVGKRNSFLENTWKSYQQAKDANSAATTEHYLCDSRDIDISEDVYYYPEGFALQLASFISTGNKQQVTELFHVLAVENTKLRHLSLYQMRWLINAVQTTLFKKRHHLPPGTEDDAEKQRLLDRIDRQFEENLNLTSLKNIALMLCDLCGTTAETSSNEMITKIQDYINANYSDSALCLTKISDEFGISENYFSFLFKKISGENFSVYLEKLRMAQAKELVCESNHPLSNIYEMVGYNNPASFRRAFKKIFGMSPKEMREKTQGK